MAKPAVKPAQNAKPQAAQTKAVGFVQANALSTDVGQKAMDAFRVAKNTDAQIADMQQENTKRKYETLMSLTQSFVKAALADKSIKLGDVHSDKAGEVEKLRDKLNVAIGIKLAAKNEDGTDKLTLAPWTKDYLPQPGESKESQAWRDKENFRTNFAAVFKKSIMAAHAIVLKDLKVETDKANPGVLLVSGKAIKERFNVDQIALNEKREVETGQKDAEGKPVKVKLAKIPSYTELGRISAESAGTTVSTRVDSRAKLGGATVTEKDIIAAIDVLSGAIVKIKNFSDEMATKLEALQDTIEKALEENEGTEGK